MSDVKVVHIDDAIKLVREWMRGIDGKSREFLQRIERQENDRNSCRDCRTPGCCYQSVLAHLFEALPIAQRLRRERLDTPELRAKLEENARVMETNDNTVYMDKAIPCVFLTDRGRCSIYRDRPIACRTYFVFSEPSKCQPPTTGRKDILALDNRGFFDAASMFGIDFAANELGLQYTEEEIYCAMLPRIVLRVLQAWDAPNFIDAIRAMDWKSVGELTAAVEGDEDDV